MRSWSVPRVALPVALFASLAQPAYSQPPARCPAPQARELNGAAADADVGPRVVPVQSVRWSGGGQLSEPARAALLASLRQIEDDGETDWVERIREQVRGHWQDEGFFKAEVDVQVIPVNAGGSQPAFSLAIRVKEGPQYRLSELRFANEKPDGPPLIFSHAVLRPLFPIEEGEIVNAGKVREGLEAVKRLYGSQGYVDMVVLPVIETDDATHRLSLLMYVQESEQFTVGSIRYLGLQGEQLRRLSHPLQPGYVFNNDQFMDFFTVNRHLLPPGAGPADVTIERNLGAATLQLTFDFRPCSEIRVTPGHR